MKTKCHVFTFSINLSSSTEFAKRGVFHGPCYVPYAETLEETREKKEKKTLKTETEQILKEKIIIHTENHDVLNLKF